MGRMIDILRSPDRRPTASTSASETAPVVEKETIAAVDEPHVTTHGAETAAPMEDDDDVPFIEVGGPREPSLRLIPSPSPGRGESRGEAAERKPKVLPLTPDPSPQRAEGRRGSLLTIRFHPVHAATISGRGPVAELIAYHQPDHAVSGQYRMLAAEIARQLPGAQPKVLLFAGGADGVGASTVLLNLAVTLARQDAGVTLVDANLARPALAQRLGLPGGPGLREVLAGRMPAAWCLQETVQPNLFVLPGGIASPQGDEYDMSPILGVLRERGDWTLIDAGRWDEAPLTASLAGMCDAVYLVVRQEALTESAALQESVMQQTGRLRGCVLTVREM
jgi:Mrp family chromosome partitioning ATPase